MALGFEKCWSQNCYCHYGYSELRAQRKKAKVCSVPGQKQHLKYPVSPFCDFDTPLFWKGQSWREREESGFRALVSPAGLAKVAQDNATSRMLLGCSPVGNASKDLRPSSLSRRTVTEMAFHELNYVLGFKANTAQKVFPSRKVLSQRSEVVLSNDGTAIPRNQSHHLSHHRAITKKPCTCIWGRDTYPELMVSIYLHFSTLK